MFNFKKRFKKIFYFFRDINKKLKALYSAFIYRIRRNKG